MTTHAENTWDLTHPAGPKTHELSGVARPFVRQFATGGVAAPMPPHVAGGASMNITGALTAQLKAFDDQRVIEKYRRFMPQVLAIAAMSKYAGTKVGALILGEDMEPLSSGWNGAARGCSADVDVRSNERDERLMWAVHAEANAIANAARTGARLKGSTIIVTHTPCMSCAKLIVQSGIVRVVCPQPDPDFALKWESEFTRTRALFTECGVTLYEY